MFYLMFRCEQCPDFETNSLTSVYVHITETMLSDGGAHDLFPVIEREVVE